MTKEQIEWNKLIAEFVGLPCPPVYDETPFGPGVSYGYYSVEELKYHSSWDWIMQVVEKIETDGSQETGHNEIHITENTCEIFRMSYVKPQFKNFDNKSKINAVWKTVVQYIQWYNTQEQNP